MNDSRRSAQKYVRDIRKNLEQKTGLFLGSLSFAFLLTWLITPDNFTDSQVYTFFIFVFSIALWITEAIPPFAVGALIMSFLLFFLGYPAFNATPELHPAKYVNTFSSSVIWLMLGGFVLAMGMEKTHLDKRLFNWAARASAGKTSRLLLCIMLTSMFASMIMSNTATAAMMLAALMPFIKKLDKNDPFVNALLLGIPASASIGGMGTIIGSPPNAIAIGILENNNITITFVEWMVVGAPVALILTLAMYKALMVRYPPKKAVFNPKVLDTEKQEKNQRYINIMAATLLVTMGLWLTSGLHGIPVYFVSTLPIVVLTMTQVLKTEDVRNLPWDTLILVAGGLSLGEAIIDTGLAEHYLNHISISRLSTYGVIILLGLVTIVVSNFMSNTAASSILIPSCILLAPDIKVAVVFSIALSASAALFLPVSTPPNAIAYSTGLIEQKKFRFTGSIGLLAPFVIITWFVILNLILNFD